MNSIMIKELINKKIVEYEKELEVCRQNANIEKPKNKEEFVKFFNDAVNLREKIKFYLGGIMALKSLSEDIKE